MPSVTLPQAQFLALPHKFRAFVGGYGSGKTWCGSAGLARHFWEWPRVPAGYFAPTYAQIRDIFYPTIDEVAFDWGLRTMINTSNKEVHVFSGKAYRGTVICRSMEKPGTIVGFKIGHALVDEIDTMPKHKATEGWRKIIARMRSNVAGLRNGIDVTTTPEGFGFTYEQFQRAPTENAGLAGMYGKVHASTYDNEANLPSGYIESLFATYPAQLVAAYLDGKFVNLHTGSVYPAFDRVLNNTDAEELAREPLEIGMDFNVGNMNAIVCIEREGLPIAVAELTGVLDTPAMIRTIKERFHDHPVTVYPDATGAARDTRNASTSDLALLKAAGFTVRAKASNPSIRSRIVSVNAMLCNAINERRLLVNTRRCPKLTEDLEQQPYDDNGMPSKEGGPDHRPDALGYYIHYRFPARKSVVELRRHDEPTGLKPFTQEWLMYGTEKEQPRHF